MCPIHVDQLFYCFQCLPVWVILSIFVCIVTPTVAYLHYFLQNYHLSRFFSDMSAAVNSSSVQTMGDITTTSCTAIRSVAQSMGDGTTDSGTAAVSVSTSGDPLSPLFVAIKIIPRSKKDRKTNCIWDFFAAVHPSVKDYRPNSYVCLVCRGRNIILLYASAELAT